MNKRIKKKWIAALRSGEYVQGRGAMLTTDEDGNDSFCCLGVLSNIHAEETGGCWVAGRKTEISSYCAIFGTLPPEVRDWADLSEADPRMGEHRYHLSDYNDGNGFGNGSNKFGQMTFKQIATMIEKSDL